MPIRLLTQSDKFKILNLDQLIFGPTDGGWSSNDFDYFFTDNSCYVFHEESTPDEPRGYIFAGQSLTGTHISNFAVQKEFEGRGIGTELMKKVMFDELKRASEQLTPYSISLQVRADNDRALKFYERHGYTVKSHTDTWVQMEITTFPELLLDNTHPPQNNLPSIVCSSSNIAPNEESAIVLPSPFTLVEGIESTKTQVLQGQLNRFFTQKISSTEITCATQDIADFSTTPY
jgi:ribosomal protein S18 acetylase RimI-like enzyme